MVRSPSAMTVRQLEKLLGRALVPVEPSAEFPHLLRARLVTYRGQGLPSLWVGVAVFATSLLLAAGAIGFVFRLVLSLVGILALINRRKLPARSRNQPS